MNTPLSHIPWFRFCSWAREKGGFWWLVIIPLSGSWCNSPDTSHVTNPACLITLVKTQGSKRNIAMFSFFFHSYLFLLLVYYICSLLLSWKLSLYFTTLPCYIHSLFFLPSLRSFSWSIADCLNLTWKKFIYNFSKYIFFRGSIWKM
jgi:hypothetical protein